MKSYFLVLSVIFFSMSGVFSQAENNDEKVALVSKDISSNTYTFNHEVDYFEAFENRLITVLNKEQEVVKSLDLKDFKCKVVFIDDVSAEICQEKIGVLVQHLNFSDYRIK
jgi:hypothetical protein